MMFIQVISLFLLIINSQGFYIPGVAPKEFKTNDKVEVEVNKLTSVKTQLPFEYYSLPVCKPQRIEDAPENLGEVLAGDTIENSLYELRMNLEQKCKKLCEKVYSKEDVKKFQEKIKDEYRVHWIIDNLPLAVQFHDEMGEPINAYEDGFPLGYGLVKDDNSKKKEIQYYLYNHIKFKIHVHSSSSFEGYRVVLFVVEPFTIKHQELENGQLNCDKKLQWQSIMKENERVYWTYDVEWIPSDVPWASRWDIYLNSGGDKIHWFSIINSLMIVLFLTGMVAMIMMRTLHKDIARYNEEPITEDTQEEFGWKLVHGDVFRPPLRSPMMLSVFVGSGVQLLTMTVPLMFFALLGFLSPANRGGLTTAMLLLFVFMGYFSGYVSSRLYKMWGGKEWRKNLLFTATFYPGCAFSVFFIVNLFVWHHGSSGAVKFSTMFALLLLWLGVSIPLCAMGCIKGFKMDVIANPARYNQIPRQIPEQPFYMNSFVSCLVGGVLPFGAVFIELFFIMTAVWLHQVYYLFGFLTLVLLILVVTCAEITVVFCYFQLCSEDYHWWWRSFCTAGSSAIYLFLYAVLYSQTRLELRFTASILYFSYMGLISFSFFLLCGSVGFLSCFWFVRTIFGSIKID